MDTCLLAETAQRQLIRIGRAAFHSLNHLLESRQRLLQLRFCRVFGRRSRFATFVLWRAVIAHQQSAE
ncbi:hypothetical protein D3C76_1645610 [compost metagenome]